MVTKPEFDGQMGCCGDKSLAECRADIYHALAEALAEPPEWLAQPGCDWPLTKAAARWEWVSDVAATAISSLGQIPAEPLKTRRARYADLFAGPGRPRFWLYESMAVYGRLLHPSTTAVEQLYRACGLHPMDAELPDHASLELAFLAHLSRQEATEPENQSRWRKVQTYFVEHHAGRWLPSLGRSLAQTKDEVYAPVGRFLVQWMADARQPSREGKAKNFTLPRMRQPTACTLCGFCVQVCPTKALKIHETEMKTYLHLIPSICTGCRKCSSICPTDALILDRSQNLMMQRKDYQTLFLSPRKRCPNCSKATLSSAEMDYVAARLDNPPWLAYCLTCRADFKEFA